MEQLDDKINNELSTLKQKIERMDGELVKYSDIEKLRVDAGFKKKV